MSLPLPRSPRDWHLTDREWESIADPVGLPAEARSAIEFAVFMFRFFKFNHGNRKRPKDIRDQLKNVAKAGKEFIAALSSLGDKEKSFLELTRYLPIDDREDEIVIAKL